MEKLRAEALSRGHDLALFAAGCFWRPESEFRSLNGVIGSAVGYSDGQTENPDYGTVCNGDTGHAESFAVEFDPNLVTYAQLVEYFFGSHNGNYGAPGDQYQSAIFVVDDRQRTVARRILEAMQARGQNSKIMISEAKSFWPAEERHQRYYEKHGMAEPLDKPTLAVRPA